MWNWDDVILVWFDYPSESGGIKTRGRDSFKTVVELTGPTSSTVEMRGAYDDVRVGDDPQLELKP